MITVITPSLNQGRFLTEGIKSIQAQKGVQIHHIIQDCCSTDETEQAYNNNKNGASNYTSQFIKYKDSGHHDALNMTIPKVTTPYVTVCNTSEYYICPTWFKECIDVMEDNKDIHLAWGMTGIIKENNKSVTGGGCRALAVIVDQIYGLQEFKQLKVGFTEVTAIIRTKSLQQALPFTENMNPWFEIQRRFYKNGGNSVMLNRMPTICREHDDSITKSYDDKKNKESFDEHYRLVDEL